jgi:hypothetical protein
VKFNQFSMHLSCQSHGDVFTRDFLYILSSFILSNNNSKRCAALKHAQNKINNISSISCLLNPHIFVFPVVVLVIDSYFVVQELLDTCIQWIPTIIMY